MYVIEGQQAEAELRDQAEADALISQLGTKGYKPLLRAMLDTSSEVAGLPKGSVTVAALLGTQARFRRLEQTRSPAGDLLFLDDHAFIIHPMGKRLRCWEIRHHSCQTALPRVCADIEGAARYSLDGRRVRGMDFNWKPIHRRPLRRFATRDPLYPEVQLDTKPPEYGPHEASAARLLAARDARSFLIRLAQVGKARSVDAAREADDVIVAPLLDQGLLRKEYLVLCRQDSHTICALTDKSEVENALGGSFACTVCGRSFRDELIQEIFALTGLGKALVTKSRWMVILLTEVLIEAGVPRDRIWWNIVAGEDELDVMVDALGSRVFFELKDREFGLGDAYPFAYRVNRYGGVFGVVVTTDRVAEEARKFFDEQQSTIGARILVAEGRKGLIEGIADTVDQISRASIQLLLAEISDPLGVDLVPIVSAWMKRRLDPAVEPEPGQ